MNKIYTSKRTNRSEIMDDFELQGPELEKTLEDLNTINHWLGGNKITHQGLQKIIKDRDKSETLIIADIGCGNGNMLREFAKWGRANNYHFHLIGVDANPYAIKIGQKLSQSYPEISFRCFDIFSEEYRKNEFDVIVCTLTLHHFTNEQIETLLELYSRQAKLGVLINDLHRSIIAYHLFQAFCMVFIRNEIARKDGLTSILRGFRKKELEKFSQKISVKNQQIKWRWAFRYQWIILK